MKQISKPPKRRRIHTIHGRRRYIAPDWAQKLREAGLDPRGDWSSIRPGEVVIESNTTQVYRVPFEGGSFFFKRYRSPRGKPWRYFLRPSRAAGEWFGLTAFRDIGIPVAEVAAFGEERILGRLDAGYMVTVGVENSANLEDFAYQTWYPLPAEKRKRVYLQIRSKLFEQLHLAHRHRLFHRDLHWRNILVRTHGDGGYETCWIDCPRAIRRRFFWRHERMVDLSCLARLALSYLGRTERYRALQTFLADQPSQTARELFAEIDRHHRRSKHPPCLVELPERPVTVDGTDTVPEPSGSTPTR
ncbi:MAG: lipopolysaccharide kinase InaA family protein [Pseudomonadota bacterium]|nr:lipopolysaccharide kinase InaA family protein [Pseudomonadota bacterium]